MDITEAGYYRQQLLDRRQRIEGVLGVPGANARLRDLLSEVDCALRRLDEGSFGLCEVCHEGIEKDFLAADPLTRFCLEHLSSAQQRALERDLELASCIQGKLLPKPGLVSGGFEVHYHYEPAGPTSGDYCDYLVSPDGDGKLTFIVGDVSGKGIAASLLMSQLHAMFHSLTSFGMPLGDLVTRVNRLFCQSVSANRFATLVCGILSPDGALEICNAGHPPPLLTRTDGVTPVEATGLPVGIFCESEYEARRYTLGPGDTLFLFTDGLPEASHDGEDYGTERVARLAGECRGLSAVAWVDAFAADLRAFLRGTPKPDDLTLMAIRRH
ncbi:MAG: SpoIIE family protein phosphatase [Acidobacteria bacterium]|nr:SpoIIE family protein phosphatase [Acidobacteriota bacterium]